MAHHGKVFAFSDIPSSVLVPDARKTLDCLALDDPRFGQTRLHAEMGGCAHFLMAIAKARLSILNNLSKSAVVVTSTDISKHMDPEAPNTTILFGDGACAALLKRGNKDKKPKITDYYERIDLDKNNILYYERKGKRWYTRMDGKTVFKIAVSGIEDSIRYMESRGYPVSCIDHFCSHQENGRILGLGMKKVKIPPEKILYTLKKYGNTSSASIGITLYEARQEIKQGQDLYETRCFYNTKLDTNIDSISRPNLLATVTTLSLHPGYCPTVAVSLPSMITYCVFEVSSDKDDTGGTLPA
jgi:hypothetical protein